MHTNRRHFIAGTGSLAVTSSLAAVEPNNKPLHVGVIGHTGRGNYGHGLDTVWQKIKQTKIVAVADPDSAGLKKSIAKLKLDTSAGFADYRQMLAATSPDIVAICPRHADQHCKMILAAIDTGAKGIYVEKPYVRTPAEADKIGAALESKSTQLAVAHRNRYHPTLKTIAKLLDDGELGRVLEIRGRGKGDRRGGAEDLWVLGSHVLNMMCFLAGKPIDCSAVMLKDGRVATKADVYEGGEGLGLLAGNELHARYRFKSGIIGYFDSIANDQTANAGFGLHIVCSKGTIALRADKEPLAHFIPGNPFLPAGKPREWLPISSAGINNPETRHEVIAGVHDHRVAVSDLLASISEQRAPICDHNEAALTIEMISAVFESHRQNGRAVEFPLAERRNPLAKL